MIKVIFGSIVFILMIQGCMINGNYSTMEDINHKIKNSYYKDLLETRKNRSGDPCIQKWRDENIMREYSLSSETFVYVFPSRCGCLIHWTINKNTGKIIGYKFDGLSCPK